MAIQMADALSALALMVAILSWLTAARANRAATFTQRFELYRDVEKFIGAWMRDARPDLTMLHLVSDAWNRSHFLFRADVTRHLRTLWVDAVDADLAARVVNGEIPGDRPTAIDRKYRLLKHHGDYDRLRAIFLPEMKLGAVQLDRWQPSRWKKRMIYLYRKAYRSMLVFPKKLSRN